MNMDNTELPAETIRRRIRAEACRFRESQLGRRLEQAKSQQERIEELTGKLAETEADRAVRLEAINELSALLKESEADRAARLDAINELTALLQGAEADRAARLEIIHRLEERMRELQACAEAEGQRTDGCGEGRQREGTFAERRGGYLALRKTRRSERSHQPAPVPRQTAAQAPGEGPTIMVSEMNQSTEGWLRDGVRRCYRIPVAGYLLRILAAMINLPKIVQNLNQQQASTEARLAGKVDRETAAEAHFLDAMYISFEDRFRGTREEIKRKLSVYLPVLSDLSPAKETVSLLDVGCGRGEWLELLRENGYRATGVDINRMAVRQCRERGLEVTEADAIAYLRGLARGSVDVITGFHILEHLSLKTVIAFFDEALSVLKSGGMIILETPNLTNILISAYDFYRDPSHIRPLHPDTVQFLAENRGFVRTGSYFVGDAGPDLNPSPSTAKSLPGASVPSLIPATDWKLDDINDYIRVPRDFALIGYKE